MKKLFCAVLITLSLVSTGIVGTTCIDSDISSFQAQSSEITICCNTNRAY